MTIEFKYIMYHRKRNISFKHDLDKIDCANWACRLLQMSYLCALASPIWSITLVYAMFINCNRQLASNCSCMANLLRRKRKDRGNWSTDCEFWSVYEKLAVSNKIFNVKYLLQYSSRMRKNRICIIIHSLLINHATSSFRILEVTRGVVNVRIY